MLMRIIRCRTTLIILVPKPAWLYLQPDRKQTLPNFKLPAEWHVVSVNRACKILFLMKTHGRFKCRQCGERFDISKDDLYLIEEGYSDTQGDTCDFCMGYTCDTYVDSHSDADPGL